MEISQFLILILNLLQYYLIVATVAELIIEQQLICPALLLYSCINDKPSF